MDDTLVIPVLVISFVTLLSASVSDWRYREISDRHWAIFFAMGVVLSVLELVGLNASPFCFTVPVCIGLIGFDCLYDRDAGGISDLLLYVSIAVTALIPVLMGDDDLATTFASIPVVYALMTLLYYVGLVKGGADVKAIISIAVVFPTYPVFTHLPLVVIPDNIIPHIFVPAFSVFVLALLITVMYAIVNVVRNLVRGDTRSPHMFIGRLMDIDDAEGAFVWPIEAVRDGEVVLVPSGNEDDGAYEALRDYGIDRVWVTAMVPFIIPICAAFVLVMVLGSPLFIFV